MTDWTAKSSQDGRGASPVLAMGLTDAGTTRDHNEDIFAICEDIGMYLVSDGMGGAQAGEVASSLVAKALPVELAAQLTEVGSPAELKTSESLRRSIEALNKHMFEQASQVDEVRGMGATVVVCLIREGIATLAHMGDSRAYLMRAGALERLTEDHALVDTLLKMGQINKEEARKHPAQHVITRYVGMEGNVGPDVGQLQLEDGDRLLLCSDGLTNMVSDRRIAEVLWTELDLAAACDRLVHAANDAGGADNITVLILQYGERPPGTGKSKKVTVRRVVGRSMQSIEPSIDESTETESPDFPVGEYEEENS